MSFEDVKQDLKNYGVETPEFSLLGTKCWARVVSVYDGDSPTVVFRFGDRVYRFPTRIYGIDTSEMKSKDVANKERALKARARLIELITRSSSVPIDATKKEIQKLLSKDVYLVWIECMELDKYGRTLISMKSSPDAEKSFADILIEEKLAYSYFGGTKLSEGQQATMD
jgi:endonuclease YncB( thermonuclease family)